MAYCSKCGKEVMDEAEICVHCGCRLKNAPIARQEFSNDGNRVARFLLTFFLGFIGSFVINHTSLKPQNWKSRTCAYFFWGIITWGIYPLIASICNFTFNPNQSSNIGYFYVNEIK